MIKESKYYEIFYVLNMIIACCMFLNIVVANGKVEKNLYVLIFVYGILTILSWILSIKFKLDGSLNLIVNVLILFSLVMLYRIDIKIAMRQCFFLSIGYLFYIIIMFYIKDISKFYKFKMVYFFLTIIFMSASFLFGKYINGSKNWVTLFGITFQPSEFGKIFLILYIASILRNKVSLKDKIMVLSLMGTMGIIFLLQKDLGTLLIIFTIGFLMYYLKTGNNLLLIFSSVFILIGGFIAYKLIPHVRVRINAWIFPHKDPYGVSYQVLQGFFSMGYGGFLGRGLYQGKLNYIPVNYTDYIFVSIVEEFGIFAGILIIILYFIFLLRVFMKVFYGIENETKLLTLGFSLLISIQAILILGGIINLIPLTGVTLPFVSYGGSSIISLFIIFSLIQKLLKES